MRNLLAALFLMIPVFAMATAAAGQTDSPADAIIPGKVVFTSGSYVCSVHLEGDTAQDGQVIAEYLDEEENLKETQTFSPAEEIKMSFSDVEPSDSVRVTWLDGEQKPRCEAAIVRFSVVYVFDWMDLADATGMMIRKYADKIEIVTQDTAYASGRLIVKTEEELPDLSAYHPELTVIDDEGHYYIQFLRDEDAIRCAAYLNTLPHVAYAEPDAPVYAVDGIN